MQMTDNLVKETIERAIVWDNHSCMPLRPNDDFLPQLERCRRVGQTAITLNVGFDMTSLEDDIRVLAHFRHWVRRHRQDYILIEAAEDVREAKRSGRLGIGFDIEGTCALGDQLSMIALYYDLGVRWMLMAYNRNNSVGGGCQDNDEGLTAFGKAVLDEMGRVGMMPCCSHTGWKTALQVIDYVQGPVLFSHSNSYAVHQHPRNIPDNLIKACAQSGGVIGVNGLGRFLGNNDNSAPAWFRHLDHIVQLVGPEHVGVALDYVWDVSDLLDHYKARPDLFPPDKGYNAPSPSIEPERLPALVGEMIQHGYSEESIRMILGGNHLRIAANWH
jgi:membrane dipeptidase